MSIILATGCILVTAIGIISIIGAIVDAHTWQKHTLHGDGNDNNV